ncbi:hypothetical protein ACFE04_025166 [Oxalis oulophora]
MTLWYQVDKDDNFLVPKFEVQKILRLLDVEHDKIPKRYEDSAKENAASTSTPPTKSIKRIRKNVLVSRQLEEKFRAKKATRSSNLEELHGVKCNNLSLIKEEWFAKKS